MRPNVGSGKQQTIPRAPKMSAKTLRSFKNSCHSVHAPSY